MDRQDPARDPAADRPTTETRDPNISTEHQDSGDARRPSDTLDRDQPDSEPEAPHRRASLTRDD